MLFGHVLNRPFFGSGIVSQPAEVAQTDGISPSLKLASVASLCASLPDRQDALFAVFSVRLGGSVRLT